MSEGNRNVVLCERGIRAYVDHSRNTLDLSVIPAVQKLSHLPILSDPSHGTASATASRRWPWPRRRGANGIIVEVHHDPTTRLATGRSPCSPISSLS